MVQIRIQDSENLIPVSKIICVGSNYGEHIREMRGSFSPPEVSEPVLFLKPPSSLIHHGDTVIKPCYSEEMHHEVECVIIIGKPGKRIPADRAGDYILGFTVGLDMTLRDLQKKAKQRGEPWAIAKGFDTSSVVGEIIPAEKIPDPGSLDLMLWVNGELKQKGNTSDMITGIKGIVELVSKYFRLEKGDLIFTGTPSGVGPVRKGDRIRATLHNLTTVEVDVDEESA